MYKLLVFNLVVVLVALLPSPSLTQANSPPRKQSIRMKSFQIKPQNPAQVQALQNLLNSDVPNGENMYFQGGRIEENVSTEILVPVAQNGESEFFQAITESGLRSGLSLQSYPVKLKFYKSSNQAHAQQSSPAQNPVHILRAGGYPEVRNTYRVQNYNSRRCMTVEGLNGVTSANNGIIDLWACTTGAANQDWNIQTPTGYSNTCGSNISCKTYFHFVNQNTGKCLTAGTNLKGEENDTPVLTNMCRYPVDKSQLWYVDRFTMIYTAVPENLKGTFYQIRSGKGDRCLSNRGDQQQAQFYLYDCNSKYMNQYYGFF